MLRSLVIVAMSALFIVFLGGVALAEDIGSEAGNYVYKFSSPDNTMVESQTLSGSEQDRLALIGTEAGDWENTSVDSEALHAAILHNQQGVVDRGSEGGNDTFDFDSREDRICSGMLC